MKDFYQTLGVPRGASPDEIKKAYRRLAKQYHPDVNKGEKAAEERFKEISEAYNVLSNPEQKKKYDMFGNSAYGGGGAGPDFSGFRWQNSGKGFDPAGGDYGEMGDLGDLFSELFNMGGVRRKGYSQGEARRSSYQPQVKGQDTFADIEIDFNDGVEGTQRKISIRRGENVEKLTVKIPAGVDNGSKVRIAGKGQPGFGGGKDGDLYLRVHVTPHQSFWREAADIYTEIPITIYDAVLGASVEVPTVRGSAKMKIPAGTSGGQKFRIGGKGAPILGKKGKKGDQYVIVKIVPPKGLKGEAKKAFEKLAKEHPYDPKD
ncbi:MAG: DnaJ domain-containing protein [Deltaproteobacteria bacterium]|jgi:curved DNA-binding protein|nr:DnaJ domain-containing protein [Deltaproteobacteria bacterium]